MMRYYKYYWDETTGDPLTDSWGTSTYYIETGEDLYPIRQLEVFENGYALKYNETFWGDNLGGLGDQQIDPAEFEIYRISKEEFEQVWQQYGHYNGPEES